MSFFFGFNGRLFDAEKTLQLHLRLDYTTKQGLSLVTSAVALKFSFQDLGGKVVE